jgi:hypothetical protein
MTSRQVFLNELADLCQKHHARFEPVLENGAVKIDFNCDLAQTWGRDLFGEFSSRVQDEHYAAPRN